MHMNNATIVSEKRCSDFTFRPHFLKFVLWWRATSKMVHVQNFIALSLNSNCTYAFARIEKWLEEAITQENADYIK